ncbi:VWA domain-containing protein [Spiroplasma alleghenense]|uniref:Two-component regulator system yiem receptor component protein n=1 Tax=Spiroplasma alleghenense TaxID=216931 RepID=A0A345Z3D7_9MOLU|nr:VWA domain-containing protein [Spiroplasma alleghenense]AXK51116.1 two-component regulator system yiem receptor component protein [Spiroplasma alleghenense]
MKQVTLINDDLFLSELNKLKQEDLDNQFFKEFKTKNKQVARQFDEKISGFYDGIMQNSASVIKLPQKVNEEIAYFHYISAKLTLINILDDLPIIRKKLFQLDSPMLENVDEINNKLIKGEISPEFAYNEFVTKWTFMLTKRVVDYRLKTIQDLRFNYLVNIYDLVNNYTKFSKAHKMLKETFEDLTSIDDNDILNNLDTINKFSDYLYKDRSILKIAEILGRLNGEDDKYEINITQKISYYETEVKLPYNPEEIVGITESKDLEHVLPAELGYLFNPILQTIFYKKFSENKLQTFLFHSKEKITEEEYVDVEFEAPIPLKQGKFIICIDTSLSMEGSGEFIAKALALAICKVALKEKREILIINFSDFEIEEIEIDPHSFPIQKILKFLSKSFYGSTNAVPAFMMAIKKMHQEKWERGDLLVISDFMLKDMPTEIREKVLELKNNYNRFHSVFVGNSPNKNLLDVFDNNMYYDPDDPKASEQIVKSLNQTLTGLDRLSDEKIDQLEKINQVNKELREEAKSRKVIKNKEGKINGNKGKI